MGISGLDSFQIADRLFVLAEGWIESRMKINSFSLQTRFTNYVTSGSWHPLPFPNTHTHTQSAFLPLTPMIFPVSVSLLPQLISYPLLISFRKITWVFDWHQEKIISFVTSTIISSFWFLNTG